MKKINYEAAIFSYHFQDLNSIILLIFESFWQLSDVFEKKTIYIKEIADPKFKTIINRTSPYENMKT